MSSSQDPDTPIEFYEDLLKTMQPSLYGYILSLVANPSDAEDVLQESNRVIIRKIGELRREDRFSAWAYRIAYFQSLALAKKRRNQPFAFNSSLLESLAESNKEISEKTERSIQRLEQCLRALQERARSIVADFYFEDLSTKQIGKKRGIAPNHVGQILFRARQALFNCITRLEKSDHE